ncbi:hypothetical protein CEP54_007770 [Fusarium duplospermum]|uniref:F-box domain-containing protein n=1 Tax=Fusarium duplospermum TaxID=1325734 RepID=A0A428PZG6_9HYPO|nr:hypothetical protein CEP54_007770 [Fusarium duplospermum]
MVSEMDIDRDGQEILDVCSYHRTDFDICLVRTRPHKLQEIAPSLQTCFDTEPTSELGFLGRFSPEILIEIILQMDIESYLRFRQVNRRARAVATRIREYKLVSTHGLEGLTAMMRTRMTANFTIRDLYEALVTCRCKLCSRFGGYLHLFDCGRYCFACVNYAPELRVTSHALTDNLCQTLDIPKLEPDMELGPVLHTVYGIYALQSPQSSSASYFLPREILSPSKIASVIASLGVPREAIDQAVKEDKRDMWSYRFAAATAYPWYDVVKGEADRGVNCKAVHLHLEKNSRYGSRLACGRDLPFLKEPEFPHRRLMFSRAEFLEHFKTCSFAQKLWRGENEGFPETESQFMRWRGNLDPEDEDGPL